MYLFLSSGARERYRQDVIRAIAMPAGMDLQFRYTRNLLSDEVKQRLNDPQTIIGKKGLIVFLDRKDKAAAQDPDLVPCRYVTVRKFEAHGNAITIQLRLDEYPKPVEAKSAAFIEGFNNEAKQQLGEGYP